MTTDEKLDTIIAKLDTIIAAIPKGTDQTTTIPAAFYPYELPELTADQIDPATADGHTVQKDGSVWTYQFPDQPPGQKGAGPFRSVYGYFSKTKAGAMYDSIANIVGRDRLEAALAQNGYYARYVGDMPAQVRSGVANFVTLNDVLANPILPR